MAAGGPGEEPPSPGGHTGDGGPHDHCPGLVVVTLGRQMLQQEVTKNLLFQLLLQAGTVWGSCSSITHGPWRDMGDAVVLPPPSVAIAVALLLWLSCMWFSGYRPVA